MAVDGSRLNKELRTIDDLLCEARLALSARLLSDRPILPAVKLAMARAGEACDKLLDLEVELED